VGGDACEDADLEEVPFVRGELLDGSAALRGGEGEVCGSVQSGQMHSGADAFMACVYA
jgi:hypothetical protein